MATTTTTTTTTSDNVTMPADIAAELTSDAERSFVHLDTMGKWTNHIVKTAVSEAVQVADRHRIAAQRADQVREDVRADRRNRNRMMMLLVVLLMTFVVPYFVSTVMNDPGLLKYSTAIAIVPDTLLTLYAAIRKY